MAIHCRAAKNSLRGTNTLLLLCRKAYIITIGDYAIRIIFLYTIQLIKDKDTRGGEAKFIRPRESLALC
jgi:hypothetical protein